MIISEKFLQIKIHSATAKHYANIKTGLLLDNSWNEMDAKTINTWFLQETEQAAHLGRLSHVTLLVLLVLVGHTNWQH